MTPALLVFAALIGTPASAFVCRPGSLPFLAVFPVIGGIRGGAGYLKRLAGISIPPAAVLVWAALGSRDAVVPSLRWLAAAGAGSFFAWVLGASGTAMVLRAAGERFPALKGFLEPLIVAMLMAGPCAGLTRAAWRETRSDRSPADRAATVLEKVFTEVEPVRAAASVSRPDAFLGCLGWLVFTLAVAGIL